MIIEKAVCSCGDKKTDIDEGDMVFQCSKCGGIYTFEKDAEFNSSFGPTKITELPNFGKYGKTFSKKGE